MISPRVMTAPGFLFNHSWSAELRGVEPITLLYCYSVLYEFLHSTGIQTGVCFDDKLTISSAFC
ncbi:MAG: hypothetical protein KAT15_21660, partial [Bacteroidales bacterium]|nr:hypothetical protein [Bacteroidales bacterium]